MRVKPFFKTHTVVIFMFLHSSPLDLITKSTALKSSFNKVYMLEIVRLKSQVETRKILVLCVRSNDAMLCTHNSSYFLVDVTDRMVSILSTFKQTMAITRCAQCPGCQAGSGCRRSPLLECRLPTGFLWHHGGASCFPLAKPAHRSERQQQQQQQ